MLVPANPTAANARAWVRKIQVARSEGVRTGPAPITPGNVLKGNPVATAAGLFRSADGMQSTVIWHCTAGTFRWDYREDETIIILEGGMTLHFDDGSSRVCGASDVVYFPAGTSCVWTIEHEVRKVALLRDPVPAPISLSLRLKRAATRALARNTYIRRVFGRGPAPAASSIQAVAG